MPSRNSLDVDGHTIAVTHLDKVIYPRTGTIKAQVIEYYSEISDVMLPHIRDRPVTRKRWPDGVQSTPFFEKNLPAHAPEWVGRVQLEHSDRSVVYPVLTSRAELVWLAQQAALELHVPQWTLGSGDGGVSYKQDRMTDRVVLDLDPGPDVTLYQCAQVALRIREMLDGIGLRSFPVTSGSKGIHIYFRLDAPISADSARKVAKQIATQLQSESPELVTAQMTKSVRGGRVFVDWSQNSASKTTLAPYSMRGRDEPCVAAPRAWDELNDKKIRHIMFDEMTARLDEFGDLLTGLEDVSPSGSAPIPRSTAAGTDVVDLGEYRRKRDENKTPEPFGDSRTDDDRAEGPMFVIQEHHARRLHYDFRLERDGVLVSWAIPKNLPLEGDKNRLAVQTEDHPIDYGNFEGDIPAGEYGGGHVEIWDRGTYETEKWRDKEIIVRLHGERIQGRYALIKTGDKNWLAHLMSDEPRPIVPDSLRDPRPMLATDESIEKLTGDKWAFEGKWDGYRILLRYIDGKLRLTSRSGIDMTKDFPALRTIADDLGLLDVVLDGEVVAFDEQGRTNFTRLAGRSEIGDVDVKFMLFDILYLNGSSLLKLTWEDRRGLLEEIGKAFRTDLVQLPPLLDGPGSAAIATSRDRGWEGVVAKRRDSTYQQGRRSKTWLKQKNWTDIEVVIGGWRPGKGGRGSRIGSLLLGLPEETGLRYVGRVGTGFSDSQLDALMAELEPLRRKTSPFLDTLDRKVASDAVWVLPKLVADVRFMDWTSAGHLRHPSWRGIRRDKLPGDL
ncbi:ATP-dependent DNA ligase LigD ligase module /ATP-dependent DNA ligase LigD phosphoesterase module /ATP-dependent DNA ligase LigD polymerase module [Williamsia limnetica]|uniref:DNA ligase (ATP) n=1 Tax=Williamsia limnetica TaxID=882452 RepID=A0A318S331_WILLI|nr:ATP-dependent DNA ligase [Williamsia limnetica]PYE18047.1 ATP-dependent DNA ligase LigD ligase module /ATP-dependent DNA ligase LigD phosphoesterase module /ATP-dependent DNA ligase LigD polymerase module [Williamsia limnetica]